MIQIVVIADPHVFCFPLIHELNVCIFSLVS
jgi:hypothetical protein